MGNQNSDINKQQKQLYRTSNCCKFVNFKPNKMFGNRTRSNSNDEFIINHLKNTQTNDHSLILQSFDERRLVFVSLSGLYQSWRSVPSVLLYTSLLLMPLKRKWIEKPAKYISQLKEKVYTHCRCSDDNQIRDFIQLLQWKQSQGLVLYTLDDSEMDKYAVQLHHFVPNPLVAPFWYRVSAKLTSLYDHIEGSNCNPLSFEEGYWANKETFCGKYNTKTKSILSELYFVTMNPSAMQEIIYQSNRGKLRPVITYGTKTQLNLAPIDVYMECNETHLVSPLSPIIENKEKESRFCFNEQMMINIDGVTPIQSDDLPTPSTYCDFDTDDAMDFTNC